MSQQTIWLLRMIMGTKKKFKMQRQQKKSDSSKTEKHDSADEVVKLKQTVVNLQKKT